MTEWTPSLVEERLSEAAFVLKRLPADRRRGYFNVWPQIVHDFADKVGQEARPMRVLPSPAAISRMEETLSWTVGMQRSAAHEHWLYALCVIAFRLNGRRLNRNHSKRHVIAQAESAKR